MSQNYYSVIVRNPNSWNAATGIREELANCGHHHKSLATAQACFDRLTAWRCLCGRTAKGYAPCCGTPHNSTSACWYHARVEDSRGEIVQLSTAQACFDRLTCVALSEGHETDCVIRMGYGICNCDGDK